MRGSSLRTKLHGTPRQPLQKQVSVDAQRTIAYRIIANVQSRDDTFLKYLQHVIDNLGRQNRNDKYVLFIDQCVRQHKRS